MKKSLGATTTSIGAEGSGSGAEEVEVPQRRGAEVMRVRPWAGPAWRRQRMGGTVS